jgi:hypothetical protein
LLHVLALFVSMNIGVRSYARGVNQPQRVCWLLSGTTIGNSATKLVATSAKSPTKGPDAKFVRRVAGAGCFVECSVWVERSAFGTEEIGNGLTRSYLRRLRFLPGVPRRRSCGALTFHFLPLRPQLVI